jgi:micrococcal nuclease
VSDPQADEARTGALALAPAPDRGRPKARSGVDARIALALALAACGSDAAPPGARCGPTRATVDRVIDGDTVVLTSGEHVRYLLVNANEITNGHNECYGAEARDENQLLVAGKEVELTYDSECTDRYGRLLAYVGLPGQPGRDVNSILVERGYACVLYIPPDGMARRSELQALQSTAMAQRAGMWGACAVVPCAN